VHFSLIFLGCRHGTSLLVWAVVVMVVIGNIQSIVTTGKKLVGHKIK
jgi:hypothetical protein